MIEKIIMKLIKMISVTICAGIIITFIYGMFNFVISYAPRPINRLSIMDENNNLVREYEGHIKYQIDNNQLTIVEYSYENSNVGERKSVLILQLNQGQTVKCERIDK